MPLPDTFYDLQQAGYIHDGAWRCPTCRRHVEMFLTPRRKRMGFVLKPDSEVRYIPHLAVCPPKEEKKTA